MPAAERARIESEAAARAAREEAQWRDAYSRRVEDKKTQWQQWDAVAAAENAERERRSTERRGGSQSAARKTPEVGRCMLNL